MAVIREGCKVLYLVSVTPCECYTVTHSLRLKLQPVAVTTQFAAQPVWPEKGTSGGDHNARASLMSKMPPHAHHSTHQCHVWLSLTWAGVRRRLGKVLHKAWLLTNFVLFMIQIGCCTAKLISEWWTMDHDHELLKSLIKNYYEFHELWILRHDSWPTQAHSCAIGHWLCS